MLRYLSADIICSEKGTVFQERNCELRGTDNVQGQISEHIFTPKEGYRVYYPRNLFRNMHCFKNWGGNILRYSPVLVSRGIFGRVTCLDQLCESEKV